jgi:hypothetical protein
MAALSNALFCVRTVQELVVWLQHRWSSSDFDVFLSGTNLCWSWLWDSNVRGTRRQTDRQKTEGHTETQFIVLWGKKKNIYYSEYSRTYPLVLLSKVENKMRRSKLNKVRKWELDCWKYFESRIVLVVLGWAAFVVCSTKRKLI